MIIFTSICANYAHKARALAESVHKNIHDATFFLCLTEKEIPEAIQKDSRFDHVILSREMWEGNFERFIFKHGLVEASTAVKGAFFQWLMKSYPEEQVFVYLDPDCYVYSDLTELREALIQKPIVLCPHLLHPGNVDMELSSTAHGAYNLGFLAVRRSEDAQRLIDWWAERLYLFCYDEIGRGIFTDQKWMDLAPSFFDVQIMHHYGYDFAPWGLLNTAVEHREDGWYIQGMPLRFIHFSGFGPVAEKCMNDWLGENNEKFRELYQEYAMIHEACNEDKISQTPWSYGFYSSGEPIASAVREQYRQNWDLMFSVENPFELSNAYFDDSFRKIEEPRSVFSLAKKKMRTAMQVMLDDGFQGVKKVMAEKRARK